MKPHAIVPVVFLSLLWSASNAVASNKHPLEGCYSMVILNTNVDSPNASERFNAGDERLALAVFKIRGKMYLMPTGLEPVNGLAGTVSGKAFSYARTFERVSQGTDEQLEEGRGHDVTKELYIKYIDPKADGFENIESSMMRLPINDGLLFALFKIKPGKRVTEFERMLDARDTKRTDYFFMFMGGHWVSKINCP